MGDRAVFGFRNGADAPTLYLYSHWGGSSQDKDLAYALLAALPRWSDPDYGTRICVSQLVGEDWKRETGYGLSVGRFPAPDYDYHYVVDWSDQTVRKFVLQADNDWVEESKQYIQDFITPLISVECRAGAW